VLASGGLDMSVVLTPAAPSVNTVTRKLVNPLATSLTVTFEESYQRKLAWTNGPSGTTLVKIARAAKLVLAMGDKDLGLWRLKEQAVQELNDETEAENNGGWDKVLELDLNVQTNLIASAISDDGRWLVVSDLYETKLFTLESNVRIVLSLRLEIGTHSV
jgi:U3 small nucleolar RNA-associated protein 4